MPRYGLRSKAGLAGNDGCGAARAGQLSLDLDHPYRLIFEPNHDPRPLRAEGDLDWSLVTSVRINGVEDTHD